MNNKFTKGLLRKKKKDIIRMLRKEGIEPNEKQSKEELIKLLGLARKANEPSRSSNKRLLRSRSMQPLVLIILTILVAGTFYALYNLNPTFNKNINFLVSLMEVENQDSENPNEPKILEKNGKTYVVYNHPLIDVEVFYDDTCKRPECEIEPYINRIKKSISPLIDIEMIDIKNKNFESKTEKLAVTLLPTFSFDNTVEKLGNFEEIRDNFISRTDEGYLLQVLPYRTLTPVDIENTNLIYGSPESETRFVSFLSLTSEQSIDILPQLEKASETYNQAGVYHKYFFRNDTDVSIAKALECSAKFESYEAMFEILTNNFNQISNASVDRLRTLLNSYVPRANIPFTDFFECFDGENQEIDALIKSHKEDANTYGVIGAPAVFINQSPQESSGVVMGYYPEKDFMKLIDDIINQEGAYNQSNDE